VNEDKGTYAERNTAKRLENEGARLKRGYLRGTLLPAVTWTAAFIIGVYSLRHFCIEGTIFDTTKAPIDRDVYYDAQRDYSDGNLAAAASQAARILAKQPNHGPANQLMARIELTRGNRKAALDHLRRSLDTSLNREEIAKWISALEASQLK
jgi:hypothetical protein